MKKLLLLTLIAAVSSCGKIETPNDILNDLTGATRDVEAYDKHKKSIKELKGKVSILTQKILDLDLSSSLKEALLNEQLLAASDQISSLVISNENLEDVVANLTTLLDEKEVQLFNLEATNEDLQVINTALVSQNGYLLNRVNYLQRYNNALLSYYCRLWYEVRSLRNQLIDKNEQIASLTEQVASLTEIVNGYDNNDVAVYLMNVLNSGVKELVIKMKNGDYIKLKDKNGNSVLSQLDEVILNNSSLL